MAFFRWITLLMLLQATWSTVTADQNRLKSLNVKCGDNDMLVDIEFNTPFSGIIFSKGYFARSECVYVKAAPSKYSYQFTIAYSGCGTTAGGSGITGGTRRSDGFLRSIDEVQQESNSTANGTRSRREIANKNGTAGAQGRSLGGWGTGMGAEFVGDPYAPKMESQDLSAGSGSGYGDPMAAGQMGNMAMGGQNWQAGGANADYSNSMPGMNMNSGGYGGGQPQQIYGQPQQNPQNNMNGAVMWNGNPNSYYSGQPQQQLPPQQPPPMQYNADVQNQNRFQQANAGQNVQQQFQQNVQPQPQQNVQPQFQQNAGVGVKVQSSASASSNTNANKFATSIPGTQSNAQFAGQQADEDKDEEEPQSNTALRANPPFGEDKTGGSSRFFENIIIIQYDANIQEVWDVAKALRCEWHDNYHKTVSYKPFQVDALEVVPATFAGDNVGVWMTVQQGKGPYAPEVNGIVRIGEYLTLAIGIQDQTKKFDMRVINCFASDGARPTVQLVDEYGCVTRPKIMSDFAKVTNYGDQASVVSYAYFQAFKFPDSVDVQLECSVEICKFGCAKQCYNKMAGEIASVSKSGTAVASISSGLSFGGSSAAARGQMSRKVDGTLADSSAASSGEHASATGKASSSSSSKQTAGSASATADSSSASVSGQKVSSGSDANEDSVNGNVKKLMQEGKLIKINKKVPRELAANTGGSRGAAIYNAMNAEDEEFDNTDDSTTKKSATTTSTKRKSIKEPAEDNEPAYRKRREAVIPDPEIQQNVGIKRRFRVVAPGDLSFLDNKANSTVVYSSQRIVGLSDVCISPTSFVAGIVVLLALLILTTLCAIVLCLRLRSLDRVSNKLKDIDLEYIKAAH